MKASIYISSGDIKLLTYSRSGSGIRVKGYYTHPLPDESVLGGVILDAGSVTEGIKSLKRNHPSAFKDISLVLDGSYVYTKQINVPGKLSAKMYRRIIKDEFSDVASDADNLICDYIIQKSDDNQSKNILAFGIEMANVRSYTEIFYSAGVELRTIHFGIRALLRYVTHRKELKNASFVLNAVDEEQMLSIIFQNTVSMLQQRTRLFPDATGSSAQSMMDGLSGIIAFNRSQNFGEITHSYYLGRSGSEISAVSRMGDHPEIRFSTMNIYSSTPGAEALPPDAFFVFLNALLPDSERDLFYNIKMQEKAKRQERPKNFYIPIAAFILLLLGAAVAALLFLTNQIEEEITELQNFLNAPATIEARDEVGMLRVETARLNSQRISTEAHINHTAALPQVSREIITVLEHVGRPNVRILGLSFNSANGIMSVSASGPSMHDASNYVERLRRESIIAEVYHTGYRIAADGEFVFTIDVIKNNWRGGVAVND
ncbi:MAG: pilus assembly protein PilM [Oscillospiraceae bacterium]|nr:pilus assembly protein PilM [Oscillospiraceae bacterium]